METVLIGLTVSVQDRQVQGDKNGLGQLGQSGSVTFVMRPADKVTKQAGDHVAIAVLHWPVLCTMREHEIELGLQIYVQV